MKVFWMAFFLGACATPLRIHVPSLRFDSSELEGGERNASFAFGMQSYNEAELSSDTQSVPVHAEPTQFKQYLFNREHASLWDAMTSVFTDYGYLYMKFAYAFEFPLELSYRFPDRLGAKVQILGKRADEAKAGDLSLSLSASYASRSSESVIGASPSTNPADSSIKLSRSIVDAAAIAGLRISDQWLLYGGPFILYTPYNVEQNLNTTTDTVSVRGQVSNYGANLGFQYRSEGGFSVKLEAVVNRMEGHRAKEDFLNGGLVLSKAF